MEEMLQANDIHLGVNDDAIRLLAAEGYDPQYEARPLKRVLQIEVLNKLSKMILTDQIDKEKKIVISSNASELIFSNV